MFISILYISNKNDIIILILIIIIMNNSKIWQDFEPVVFTKKKSQTSEDPKNKSYACHFFFPSALVKIK